ETLDSNVDSNVVRKCVNSPSELSLRSNSQGDQEEPSSSCANTNLSAGGQILLKLMNDELTRVSTKVKAPHAAPKNEFRVYNVIDYDEVEFIGYEYHYDFVGIDYRTSKPYSRNAEIDYTIKDIKQLLRSSSMAFTASEVDQLKHLFIQHPL